jgi:hypothetical protein
LRIAELLVEEKPQAALWIGPKVAHQRAAELLREVGARADGQPRFRPASPSSAVKKVVLLISNDLHQISAIFLHYILHRF